MNAPWYTLGLIASREIEAISVFASSSSLLSFVVVGAPTGAGMCAAKSATGCGAGVAAAGVAVVVFTAARFATRCARARIACAVAGGNACTVLSGVFVPEMVKNSDGSEMHWNSRLQVSVDNTISGVDSYTTYKKHQRPKSCQPVNVWRLRRRAPV